MEVQNQAARDKPSVSRVELFDSLMSISYDKSLSKKSSLFIKRQI